MPRKLYDLTLAEEKEIKAKISQALLKDCQRKAEAIYKNYPLKHCYEDLAYACEDNDGGVNAVKVMRRLEHDLMDASTTLPLKTKLSMQRKLYIFLDKRDALMEQFDVEIPLGF